MEKFVCTMIARLHRFPLPEFLYPYFMISVIGYGLSILQPKVFLDEDFLLFDFYFLGKHKIFFKDIIEINWIAPYDQQVNLPITGGDYPYPLVYMQGEDGMMRYKWNRGFLIKYRDGARESFSTFIVIDFLRLKTLLEEKMHRKFDFKSVDLKNPLLFEVLGRGAWKYELVKNIFIYFISLLFLIPLSVYFGGVILIIIMIYIICAPIITVLLLYLYYGFVVKLDRVRKEQVN